MHSKVNHKVNIKSWYSLLKLLGYGLKSAKTSETLWIEAGRPGSLSYFRRKLRTYAHQARLNGHWVVADDNGYYIAINKKEWTNYKLRRISSIKDEMEAIANCDRSSISDLIKNVFSIKLDDPNYELF